MWVGSAVGKWGTGSERRGKVECRRRSREGAGRMLPTREADVQSREDSDEGLRGHGDPHNAVAQTWNRIGASGLENPTENGVLQSNPSGATYRWEGGQIDEKRQRHGTHNVGQEVGGRKVRGVGL